MRFEDKVFIKQRLLEERIKTIQSSDKLIKKYFKKE